MLISVSCRGDVRSSDCSALPEGEILISHCRLVWCETDMQQKVDRPRICRGVFIPGLRNGYYLEELSPCMKYCGACFSWHAISLLSDCIERSCVDGS